MTKRPQDYARCLTRLVEITSGPRFALAPGAILSRKQLFRRFDMILNSSRNTFGRVSRLMLASSLAIIITIGAACLMISPAIAFSPGGMTYFELSQMLDERLGSTPDTPEKAIEIAPVGESVDEPLAENTDSQPIRTEKSVTIDAAAKPEPITLDPKTTKSPVDVLIDQGEGDFHLSSGFAGIGTDSHGDFRYVRHNHQKGGYEDAIRQFERSVSGVFSGNVINDHDGGYTYYHNKGRRKIIIDIDGDYEISDDLKSIKPKGNGSSIIIEERLRSKSTELYLALDRHGREELEYYIDGDSAEYDQDAKEWLANLLLFAATNSGVWTDKHVALLLKEGGVDEVLQTVESFDSDYIKRMYYQEMLIQAKVNDEQLDRILGSVEREIDSDHEKAELLIVLAREYDVDRLQSKEFVDAVSSLDSDYEMRRVLGEMAFDDSVSPEVILEVLDLAGKMGSDYERAELLLDLADVSRKEPKTRKAYYKAVEEMGSDYETRRVLTALGFDENIDDDELRELLVITSHLSSDYEKATVLSDLIDPIEHHPDLHLKWLDAISDIDSDYEMANLLTSFIRQVDMGDSVTLETIRMADRISSDYEKARMLKRLEKHIGDNAELEAAFNDAVESIDSDYEREQFSRGKRRSGSGSY